MKSDMYLNYDAVKIRSQQDNHIDFMPYANINSITHSKLIRTGVKLPLQFVLCDYMTLI